MAKDILINVGVGEVRVAVVENGRLQALSATRLLGAEEIGGGLIGDIVLGRVVRVLPAVQAAFVDIGHERSGFLAARETRSLSPDPTVEPEISRVVREGDAVLVQIIKDPIGEKGPRLTTGISVPGRLCVYTPLQNGVAISRRITQEVERDRLRALVEPLFVSGEFKGGCILRTAAVGAGEEELREDLLRLQEEWGEISALAKRARIPSTLRKDLGPVERVLRDFVHNDTARILIDNAAAAERARAYCRDNIPEIEERIALFAGPGSLFGDLESDIEGLVQPRVPLPCGGWVTIEGTEALTAIDVNSGSFIHANAVEDTGFTVNLEAAEEIGRQIRLRGIGGLIVIDFIHLAVPDHMDRVLAVLSQSLARDGVPVTVGPLTQLGLVEITRKRLREPLVELWSEDCPTCAGTGLVRRADVVALDVLRRIEETARATPGQAIIAHAAPDVIAWLVEQGAVDALARNGIGRVTLEVDVNFSRDRIEVGTVA